MSFETIGQIKDYKKFVSEVKRVSKPNARIIISCPNYPDSWIGRRMFRKKKWHRSMLTKEQFINLFKDNFVQTELYFQEKAFTSFPGRGIINKILRVKRDHMIKRFENSEYEPRTIICIGMTKESSK